MKQKNEKPVSTSQKPESVGIRAAHIVKSGNTKSAWIGVLGAVLAAVTIFALNSFYKKNQTEGQVIVGYVPTPQTIPSPSPQTTTYSPLLTTAPAKKPVEQGSNRSANRLRELNLPEPSNQNISSLQKQMPVDNRGEMLDGYIREYLDKYSSIDLEDDPCDSELKRSAEALLGRIESLGNELKRKDPTDFASERRGFSIKFHDCKTSNS